MTTETIYFGKKSGGTGNRGTATKGESVFTIRELQNSWKLICGSASVKFELVYSKKDLADINDLVAELKKQGYTINLD